MYPEIRLHHLLNNLLSDPRVVSVTAVTKNLSILTEYILYLIVCILQVLLLLKVQTHLHPTALLMLNLNVLDWSLKSPAAFKTWMKPTHACHLALLQLAVTVNFASSICSAYLVYSIVPTQGLFTPAFTLHNAL